MNAEKRRKSTNEIVDLILKHDPNVSMQKIADIISEWGDLFDDRRWGAQHSTGEKYAEAADRTGLKH
jgi:hypothetical protein